MDTNIVRDITDLYFNQVIGDYVTEVSADLALKASKEAGKRAGVLAGLSGGDPKVEAKARKKRAQAERLYSKQAKKRVVNVSPIKEDENVVDETSHLETDMKKRREANEKAVKDMKKTDAYKSMSATAAKKFDEETEPDPFGRPGGKYGGVKKGGGYDRGYQAMQKKLKELDKVKTEALDPVGHEDDDVDNDGKKNTNADKYLKNRRKTIGKAISTQEEKEVKRWWDDDGDGKGYEEGEVSGKFKKKKKIKESFSNWREDLIEVADKIKSNDSNYGEKVVEKKVNNKITINPNLDLGEAIENLGGTLLEMVEIDEVDYIVESVYDELLEEGYEEDDIEEALEYALTEATVTFGHDTPTGQKKKGNLLKAVGRLARQKLSSKVRSAKKAAAGAVAKGARKVAKGALGVARKMEGGDKTPSAAHTKTRTSSTYRGAGAGQKERVSSGSYTPPTKKKAEKPADPWEGSASTPPKAKEKTKKAAAPKAKAATEPKRKRKSKLDDLLASVRSEEIQIDEKTLTGAETKEKERIVKSMKSKEADFEKRYPGRGKEVMYATATKMAKRIAEQAMELHPKTQSQTQQSAQDAKAKSIAQKAKQAAITLKTKELQTIRQTPAGTSVSSFG